MVFENSVAEKKISVERKVAGPNPNPNANAVLTTKKKINSFI